MRKLVLLFFSLFILSFAYGQKGNRIENIIYLSPIENGKHLNEANVPFYGTKPFFSYFVEWSEGNVELNIRFLTDDDKWTNWQVLAREEHNLEKYITQLYFGQTNYKRYQLEVIDSRTELSQPPRVKIHFYNPEQSKLPASNPPTPTKDLTACPCPMPVFQDRNDWCSTTNCPEHPSPSTTAVSHLIIHHSAGPNSSSDWAATVRSIWDFHVNGNGWSDVGYNWLIDPNGIVYQGRGDNIQGAHFCGHNSKTMGICMMGTFTDITPTDEAISTLESLLAWKSCDRGIVPLESSFHPSSSATIPNIAGHRDGCNTACPGDSFYPLLPDLRQGVVDFISSNCAAVATEDHLLADESVLVSPNPIEDQFTFLFSNTLQGDLHWQLFNIQQKEMLSGQSSKNNFLYKETIATKNLAAGFYFLHIQIEGKKGVWKLVKS